MGVCAQSMAMVILHGVALTAFISALPHHVNHKMTCEIIKLYLNWAHMSRAPGLPV